MKQEEKHIWDQRIRIEEITGKTIAILSTGEIGKEIARLAKEFQMTTLGYNRSRNSVSGIERLICQPFLAANRIGLSKFLNIN